MAKFEAAWHYALVGRDVFGRTLMTGRRSGARFVWRAAVVRYAPGGTRRRRFGSRPYAPTNRLRGDRDGQSATGRDRATAPSILAQRPLHATGRRDAFASRGPGKSRTHGRGWRRRRNGRSAACA